MGNYQGNPALAYGSALGQLHSGYPAIAAPPVTPVTTDPATTVALWSRVRDAEERAVKAETGKMAARMSGDKWQSKYEEAMEELKSLQSKYEEAMEEVKRLQDKSRADEKRKGVLSQCVASLKKRLARQEKDKKEGGGVEGVEMSSSRTSHSDPPRKRRREDESTHIQDKYTAAKETVPGATSEKDLATVQQTQQRQEEALIEQRDKLAADCARLRVILARFGVADEADFEDGKAETVPVAPPHPAKLMKQVEAAEACNRELMQILEKVWNFDEEELSFMCPFDNCKRVFNKISTVAEHTTSDHYWQGSLYVQCTQCFEKFENDRTFENHQLTCKMGHAALGANMWDEEETEEEREDRLELEKKLLTCPYPSCNFFTNSKGRRIFKHMIKAHGNDGRACYKCKCGMKRRSPRIILFHRYSECRGSDIEWYFENPAANKKTDECGQLASIDNGHAI